MFVTTLILLVCLVLPGTLYSQQRHEVCVDGFWMGKYEVTQGEWQKVMGNIRPFARMARTIPWHTFLGMTPRSSFGSSKAPTETSMAFACQAKLSGNMRAEVEGKREKFAGGNSADSVAWFKKNSGGSQHRAGTKQPNGLGIYDMSGNVRELCADVLDESAYAKHEGKNPFIRSGDSNRVIRGGAWHGGKIAVRCGIRSVFDPETRRDRVGLRLMRTD
jgi:formylglycine-generating enzyme required for sulfatase activity